MIDEIKSAPVGAVLWDKGDKQSVKGLHLRVVSAKRKSFYLFYRTKARQQRRFKVGDFGEITLAQARKRAKELLELVAQGKDPKGEWNALKQEPTIADLYARAMDEKKGLWTRERYQKSGHARIVGYLWGKHLKDEFGKLKISELTTVRIRDWHRDIAMEIYAANRSLEVLSRLFTFGQEVGLVPLGVNPCRGVKAHTEKKRKRYAKPEELKKIWELLDARIRKTPRGVAFLKVLFLTGARPKSLEDARPENLTVVQGPEGDFGVLTFQGKTSEDTGEEETVVLPPLALQIIRSLPPSKSGTLLGCKLPKRLWWTVRTKAGCPDLWARDSRRTFATVGMSDGVSQGIVGGLLNHRSAQTTMIYAKVMDQTRIQAASVIADKVVSIAEGKRKAV